MENKINLLRLELAEIETQLQDSNIYSSKEYPKLARRKQFIETVIDLYEHLISDRKSLLETKELLNSDDEEMKTMASEEVSILEKVSNDLSRYEDVRRELRKLPGFQQRGLDLYPVLQQDENSQKPAVFYNMQHLPAEEGQQLASSHRERHARRAAFEEAHFECFFQGANLPAYSGLRDVKLVRGAGQMTQFSHRHKGLELVNFHVQSLSRARRRVELLHCNI